MPGYEFCPHCGDERALGDDFHDQNLTCQRCGKVFPLGADVRQLVAAVTQRLAALEQRLDRLQPAVASQPAPAAAVSPSYLRELQRRNAELATARTQPKPPEPAPPRPQRRLEGIPVAIAVEEPVEAPVAPRREIPRFSKPTPRPKGELEQTIGLKWAGWVGAIVLVVGLGLGIKFGYEQGWFKFMTAEMRLGAMALVGFGLLGAGEFVCRRINRVSAAALFGAGVATLFVVSYAGNVYFRPGGLPLYSREVAFILAALTTLIGAAIAMRGRLVTIAILAHIGGNLAPFILRGGEPGVPFYSYLYMLQVVALMLALWGHSPQWWALRVLALGTTSFWVIASLTGGAGGHGLTDELLWFALLYAFTFHGELLRSCLRIAGTMGAEPVRPSAKSELSGGAIFSTFVTASITALMLFVLRHEDAALRGCIVLAFAALCLAGGFLLPLREGESLKALAIGYRVQGLALVILSVPVFLSGVWISLAWMLLSLTFAVLGARLGRQDGRIAGLVTWFLALLAWLIELASATSGQGANAEWLTILDHPIRAATVLAWFLALAGQALAWLMSTDLSESEQKLDKRWEPLGLFVSGIGSVLLVLATLAGLPPLGATLVLILWAWLLVGLDLVPNRLGLTLHALIILISTTLKWAFRDALATRLTPGWDASEYLPLWNPLMGLGLLLAASLGTIGWLRRESLERNFRAIQASGAGVFAFGLALAVAAVLTFGLSMEVDRLLTQTAASATLDWPLWQLRSLCFTMLWTLAVLAVAWIGRRLDMVTPLPWVLLIILAAKFLVIDTLGARLGMTTPVPTFVLLNVQVLAAAVLLGGLIALRYLSPLTRQMVDTAKALGWITAGLCVLIGLWIGTLEIDRAFSSGLAAGLSDAGRAKLVAISIFWSVYALASVAAGFRIRTSWLRWFGLALFTITLIKVGTYDLQDVTTGYRILSCMGLGLLLLGTSVLYGKLSPILLGEEGTKTEDLERSEAETHSQ